MKSGKRRKNGTGRGKKCESGRRRAKATEKNSLADATDCRSAEASFTILASLFNKKLKFERWRQPDAALAWKTTSEEWWAHPRDSPRGAPTFGGTQVRLEGASTRSWIDALRSDKPGTGSDANSGYPYIFRPDSGTVGPRERPAVCIRTSRRSGVTQCCDTSLASPIVASEHGRTCKLELLA